MDRNEANIALNNQEVKIIDRHQIYLSGIKKIDSFDNEEFLMQSSMGNILLKGEELEILRLDTHDGNVKIKGIINSIDYIDDKQKNKEESFIAKLFK